MNGNVPPTLISAETLAVVALLRRRRQLSCSALGPEPLLRMLRDTGPIRRDVVDAPAIAASPFVGAQDEAGWRTGALVDLPRIEEPADDPEANYAIEIGRPDDRRIQGYRTLAAAQVAYDLAVENFAEAEVKLTDRVSAAYRISSETHNEVVRTHGVIRSNREPLKRFPRR